MCGDGGAEDTHGGMVARAIIFYQRYISPMKAGPTCRFTPTCSAYALTAVRRYGVVRGLILTIVRLSKCGPWHPGGWDPVPPKDIQRGLYPRLRKRHGDD